MVVIIDYGIGNLNAVLNMYKRLGIPAQISADPDVVKCANKIILPGVGAYDACVQKLHQSGLLPIIEYRVLKDHIPILGICVGLQLFSKGSEEGNLSGLGWIDGEVIRFRSELLPPSYKVPHMGWNILNVHANSRILSGLMSESRFYFVHSYHFVSMDNLGVVSTSTYGYDFDAVIEKANIYGVQFHPEKSHRYGMQLLKNFASL